MTRIGRRDFGALLVVVALFPSLVHGQPVPARESEPSVAMTFRDLGMAIEPGQRLTVTTNDGATIRGRFQGLDASRLFLRTGDGNREFSDGNVREIRRRGDRLWNGALIGLGAGAVGGAVFGQSRPGCSGDSFCAAIGFWAGAGIGAVLGLIVDAFMPHDDLLYAGAKIQSHRWVVEPLVGVHGYGTRLTKTF